MTQIRDHPEEVQTHILIEGHEHDSDQKSFREGANSHPKRRP